MKKLKLYHWLFLRLLLIIAVIIVGWLVLRFHYTYTTIFFGGLVLVLLAETYSFTKNSFVFFDRTIAAILQNDFSADFKNHRSYNSYQSLFKLYDVLKKEQHKQFSQDLVYRSILNTIETGILILQKSDDSWNIFLMNDYFSQHFKVPKVSKWSYLVPHFKPLCELIEHHEFSEIRTSLQIRVNKEDTQTFMMQAARTKTLHGEYYVVFLDSIQKVVDKKEKDAWINLMKVISHELLNSITPIRSLSQNLQETIEQESITEEDLDDMRQSVNTMLQRSNHLQQFVESYRKLAMLPTPNKEKTSLRTLVSDSIAIMQPLFKKQAITISNKINFDRWLSIDKLQMEQVLINLLTNSMYSIEKEPEKHITVDAEVKNNRVFITITDSGKGIDKEIEDKIFLPFFTTRNDGAGIGLTLSKNIVEAHGGYLVYQNHEGFTRFMICLVE